MEAAGTLSAGLDPGGTAYVMLATVQGFMLQKLLQAYELDPATCLAAATRVFDGAGQSAEE